MTRTPLIKIILLISLLAGIGILFLTTIQRASLPVIDEQFDDTHIQLSADKRWILRSGECMAVTWMVDGIDAIYIDGEGKIGEGELTYCPTVNATSPLIEVIDNDGVYRTFTLDVLFLPDFLFYLVGFLGLAFTLVFSIYQFAIYRFDLPFPIWSMIIVMLVLAVFGGVMRLSATSPQPINEQYGEISLSYWAEHQSILFPDECVQVTWSVVGADRILFNGQDVTEQGNPAQGFHCAVNGDEAILDVFDAEGNQYTESIAIPSLLPHLERTTWFFYWSIIGLILAGIIYIPLMVGRIRQGFASKQYQDLLVIATFFIFMLFLYLPFGFESIGHWEEWIINAYLEGKQADIISSEMVSRFWVIVPHTLAYIITSESFVGYHLVHFLMFWGKLVMLYGIFRHLQVSRFYAFLVTMLFMVYPVNSALMSLRSFPMQFSMISLLVAIFLILDYRKHPSRLKLAGVWLGLLFNVTSNESAYVIILIIPLIGWLRDRQISWGKFNLTAIWYLYPAFKVAWLLFLSSTDRNFYQSGIVNTAVGSTESAPDNLGIFTWVMDTVYRNTFIQGWQEAFLSLNDATYVLIALIMVGFVVTIAWWLSLQDHALPSLRRHILTIVTGFLLVIPSVGVLMWIPLYRNDPWRMYFYVPVGAAIAVFGMVLLVIRWLPNQRWRDLSLIAVMTILIFPSTVRLLNQHASYITSANNKAQVLRDIVQQAPQFDPSAYIILTTGLSNDALEDLEIFEFVRRDMLDSVLSVIYKENAPRYAYFCLLEGTCSTTETELKLFYPIERFLNYDEILLFDVRNDLSATLLETVPTQLGFPADITAYDADALIDKNAELPSRAITMLGVRR